MDYMIESFVQSIVPGELQSHGHMAVVPLYSKEAGPEYLTLGSALINGAIKITEVGDGGSVPQLTVSTVGKSVLMLDGEELAGAKQNRVLNTTILLAPYADVCIPVSCTEQGRWTPISSEFFDSGTMMTPGMRSGKVASVSHSLNNAGCYHSNQISVWEDINRLSGQMDVSSATGAMRDVFTSQEGALEDYATAFPVSEGQSGICVLLDGAVVGLDILSRSKAYAKLHLKLVRSYALEAMLLRGNPITPDTSTATAFLAELCMGVARKYPSVGLGSDYRISGERLVGSALVVDDSVVHLGAFPVTHEDEITSMAGFKERARYAAGHVNINV